MGKPGSARALSSDSEFIAVVKQTQGTETSKYLEEKESTEIPPVAVSEGGTAQTCFRKETGVRTAM